jgi:hypothetical protein
MGSFRRASAPYLRRRPCTVNVRTLISICPPVPRRREWRTRTRTQVNRFLDHLEVLRVFRAIDRLEEQVSPVLVHQALECRSAAGSDDRAQRGGTLRSAFLVALTLAIRVFGATAILARRRSGLLGLRFCGRFGHLLGQLLPLVRRQAALFSQGSRGEHDYGCGWR